MRDGLRALGDNSAGIGERVELKFIDPAGSVYYG
jgi:hypothetical protein